MNMDGPYVSYKYHTCLRLSPSLQQEICQVEVDVKKNWRQLFLSVT